MNELEIGFLLKVTQSLSQETRHALKGKSLQGKSLKGKSLNWKPLNVKWCRVYWNESFVSKVTWIVWWEEQFVLKVKYRFVGQKQRMEEDVNYLELMI